MIQTINTKARCMLLDAELGIQFWAEAVRTQVYLHRCSPTNNLPAGQSPHEMLYGSRPPLHHLRRFGCTVYRHIPKEQREGKFSDRGRACMMLGYVHNTTKIWRVWDFSGRGRAVESSNVVFVECENAVTHRTTGGLSDAAGLVFPTSAGEGTLLAGTGTQVIPTSVDIRPEERPGIVNTIQAVTSPQSRHTLEGIGTPVGSKDRPESQESTYLPTVGEELGPL